MWRKTIFGMLLVEHLPYAKNYGTPRYHYFEGRVHVPYPSFGRQKSDSRKKSAVFSKLVLHVRSLLWILKYLFLGTPIAVCLYTGHKYVQGPGDLRKENYLDLSGSSNGKQTFNFSFSNWAWVTGAMMVGGSWEEFQVETPECEQSGRLPSHCMKFFKKKGIPFLNKI